MYSLKRGNNSLLIPLSPLRKTTVFSLERITTVKIPDMQNGMWPHELGEG